MNRRQAIQTSLENRAMQARIIAKFWPLAAVVLSIFIFFSFFILNQIISGIIESLCLILVVTLVPFCLRTGRIGLASNLLPALGMVTIFGFMFTGGPSGAGMWWSIVYVVGVFLVTDKKWALLWLTFYFLAALVVAIMANFNLVKIPYTNRSLIHMGLVYLATLAFVYQFTKVRDYYLDLARQKSMDLAKINRQLSGANRELEQLAYVASHDLQEPLQTILNYTWLVEQEYGNRVDDEGRQYLKVLSKASSRMKHLIKDILDHSRVGRNHSIGNVNCKDVLKEVLEQMETTVKESKAEILASNLPVVQGNKLELRLLFQNLISNAIKFHQVGVDPKLEISAKENGNHYYFSFKDNGIGFDEKYKNRIFVIFQRLHGEDEFPGTGIGLATCRKIVERHQGRIGVNSTPGEGSNFYFSLPKA